MRRVIVIRWMILLVSMVSFALGNGRGMLCSEQSVTTSPLRQSELVELHDDRSGVFFDLPDDVARSEDLPTQDSEVSGDETSVDGLIVHSLASEKLVGDRYYYDAQVLLAALQGLVNRDKPRLFLLVPKDPSYEDFWYDRQPPGSGYDDYDSFWLDILRQQGRIDAVRRIDDLSVLLDRFRTFYKGVVVWHDDLPATLNAAFTLAGTDAYLPVRYSPDEDSLYGRYVATGILRIALDLSFLASKSSVYDYLIDRTLANGRCNDHILGYVVDGYAATHPENTSSVNQYGQVISRHVYNNQVLSRDYLVAERAFHFDLQPYAEPNPIDDPGQPSGADYEQLDRILSLARSRLPNKVIGTVIGFPNWLYKYAESSGGRPGWEVEWRFAEMLSRHDFAMDADPVHPAGMSNASVYRHFPLRIKAPSTRPDDPPEYDPAKTYVHIMIGDFDSSSWIWYHGRYLWNDPARSSIPLSWGFNPNTMARIAPILEYYFASASANDSFVGANSGGGYLNPGFLDEQGLDRWRESCRSSFKEMGLRSTGWTLNGFAGAFSDQVLKNYADCSPLGIVTHEAMQDGGSIALVGSTPVIRELSFRENDSSLAISLRIDSTAEHLAGLILDNTPNHRMIAIRNVLMEPTRLRALADALQRSNMVQVVDQESFFRFARRRALDLGARIIR